MAPLILAIGVYTLMAVGAWVALSSPASSWAHGVGISRSVGWLAATAIVLIAWILLFSTLFVALAGVFCGFLWDRLASDVEELDGGAPPLAKLSSAVLVGDALLRLVLALVVGIATLVGVLVASPLAPVVGWAAASFLGLLDYSSPASLRRCRRHAPRPKAGCG